MAEASVKDIAAKLSDSTALYEKFYEACQAEGKAASECMVDLEANKDDPSVSEYLKAAGTSTPAEEPKKEEAKKDEPKKDESKNEGRMHSGYARFLVGGTSQLRGAELGPCDPSIGFECTEEPKSKLIVGLGAEMGYIFSYPTKGLGFEGKVGVRYSQIVTENPKDPGQSRTAVPADIVGAHLVISPKLAYRGDSWGFAIGPQIGLGGMFLVGGDNDEIKTGYSGTIGNDKFAYFDVPIGIDMSVYFALNANVDLGFSFTYEYGATQSRQNSLNDGGLVNKIGVDHRAFGGVEIRFGQGSK